MRGSRTNVHFHTYKMLLLHNPKNLLTLYKSLARSIPESLKVRGQQAVGVGVLRMTKQQGLLIPVLPC